MRIAFIDFVLAMIATFSSEARMIRKKSMPNWLARTLGRLHLVEPDRIGSKIILHFLFAASLVTLLQNTAANADCKTEEGKAYTGVFSALSIELSEKRCRDGQKLSCRDARLRCVNSQMWVEHLTKVLRDFESLARECRDDWSFDIFGIRSDPKNLEDARSRHRTSFQELLSGAQNELKFYCSPPILENYCGDPAKGTPEPPCGQ